MAEFGELYWGVRITRGRKKRTLFVHADRIEVRDGDLLLFGHMKNSQTEAGSFLFRSFAHGTWHDVFAASCLDGSECSEEHDYDDTTGKDLRVA